MNFTAVTDQRHLHVMIRYFRGKKQTFWMEVLYFGVQYMRSVYWFISSWQLFFRPLNFLFIGRCLIQHHFLYFNGWSNANMSSFLFKTQKQNVRRQKKKKGSRLPFVCNYKILHRTFIYDQKRIFTGNLTLYKLN